MSLTKEFTYRLRALMAQKGIDEVQLSELTGLNEKIVSKYVSLDHLKQPKISSLAKLALALDVSTDELLGIIVDKKEELEKSIETVALNANELSQEQKRSLVLALIQ